MNWGENKKSTFLQQDEKPKYTKVVSGSCNDLDDYTFIETEQECENALDWYYKQNTIDLNINKDVNGGSSGRWFVWNNSTPRPYGCYYYPAGKKVVHPKNTTDKTFGSSNPKSSSATNNRHQICVLLDKLPEEKKEDTPEAKTEKDTTKDTAKDTTKNTEAKKEEQKAKIIQPILVPFCQLNKSTSRGEDILITKNVYTCPEGSTLYCPDKFDLDDHDTGCVWKKGGSVPEKIPTPQCKPDVAKTVAIEECLPNEVTEQLCQTKSGMIAFCQRSDPSDITSDCLCAPDQEVKEITCRRKTDLSEEENAEMSCGDYGTDYQLACPDGYILNSDYLCELIDTSSTLLNESDELIIEEI